MAEPRFKTHLTEEDLKSAVTQKAKYVNGGWYKFRCVSAVGTVSKAEIYKQGTPEEKWPSGNRMLVESWQALRPDGSIATKAPEIVTYTTIYSRPLPALLKEKGYTDAMIEHVSQNGPPDVFDGIKQRLVAHDPDTFASKKDSSGKWNMTVMEARDLIIQAQDYFYENAADLKSDEVFMKVYVEENGGFINYKARYPKNNANPPKKVDGTLETILDPDAK